MTRCWSSGSSGWSTRPSTSGGSTRPDRRSARRTSAGTGGCRSRTAGGSTADRRKHRYGRGVAEETFARTLPTLAAIFTPDQPPERLGPVAAGGLEQLWVWEDCFRESGIATAAAVLATTSRLGVGIGLLPVPLRNVALTAMEIATLARLFPGRLTVGVGHGVLDWMGQVGARVESPMTLLREYIAALYALLHGQTVTTHGRYVHLDNVTLDWPPVVVPPLLVGGIRPRTVALAGELADGGIIPGGHSPAGVPAALG